MVLEGFVACVRKRNKYQQTVKMKPNVIPKSMNKPYEINARKNDATNITNHQTWIPKGRQQTSNKNKTNPKHNGKNEASPHLAWRTLAPKKHI